MIKFLFIPDPSNSQNRDGVNGNKFTARESALPK
jgi:hypothetical protein